jgi:hypothetical protein
MTVVAGNRSTVQASYIYLSDVEHDENRIRQCSFNQSTVDSHAAKIIFTESI